MAPASTPSPGSPSKLHKVCRKTKLCRFHLLGMCSREDACDFAHGEAELHPLPDLSRTKTCHAFATTGRCDRRGCRFAHSREELRRVRLMAQQESTTQPSIMPEALEAVVNVGVVEQNDKKFRDATCAQNSFGRQLSISTAASDHEPALLWPESPRLQGVRAPLAGSAGSLQALSDGGLAMLPPGISLPPDVSGAGMTSAFNEVATDEPRRGRFRKTKLCTFFQQGNCRKQHLCNFAHSLEELNPLPDLLRTKLCKAMLAGGQCTADGSCRFAHSSKELRVPQAQVENMAQSLVGQFPIGCRIAI